jgi:hypothetical protein
MYPDGASTFVEVAGLSERLDGASRPGHFRGVATVVAKLLHIFAPERAFFGQKDAAQVAVLRKMVRDLQFPVQLDVCPTVREPDGLALSSRNRYLNDEQRRQALVLSRALLAVQQQVQGGEHDAGKLLAHGLCASLKEEPAVRGGLLAASSIPRRSRMCRCEPRRAGGRGRVCWRHAADRQSPALSGHGQTRWVAADFFQSYLRPETKGLPASRKRAGRAASLLIPIRGVTSTCGARKPSS